MLLHGSKIIGTPIMGLQTGSELARTKHAIVDPRNLTVIAYSLDGPLLGNDNLVLRVADIRELSNIGMIIDSSDEFVEPADIISLQKVLDFGFELIGMAVVDESKHKLGKVIDYTLDPTSFVIQQLTVKRPMLRSLSETELLIHRSQVVEITDTVIIVKTTAQKPEPLKEAVRNYQNPFRNTNPQPEATTLRD